MICYGEVRVVKKSIIVLGCSIAMLCFTGLAFSAEKACITCHKDISPGQVADWQSSKHSKEDVTCSVCHGEGHKRP
jgi:uncharacterized CHY-type Zn-finger protein